MAVEYPPAYKFPFRAGPYTPPTVKVGATVHDEYYGDVTVEGMTDHADPLAGFPLQTWPAQGSHADPLRRPGPRRGGRRRGGRGALSGA